MSVVKFLPTFKQIEPDNLYGLTMGYVVAQTPADLTSVPLKKVNPGEENEVDFIENGILLALDATGKKVIAATGKERQLFIHFTEELNQVIEGRKYYALEVQDGEAYPRLVALVPGSVWTTNQTYTETVLTNAGIVVINDDATLPDGRAAKTYMYVGKVDA